MYKLFKKIIFTKLGDSNWCKIGMIPQDGGPEKLVNTLVIDNSLENF